MIEESVTSARHPEPAGEPVAGAPRPTAFYFVVSGPYFLGAVALVNSLRLKGHAEPIFALDRGLSPAQRKLLAREATLVPAPDQTTPFVLKAVAPLRHPAEVMVLIDADMIVTRSMAELIDRARRGLVMAVEHGRDRSFPEWGELLRRPARHRRYVSSSLVLLGGGAGSDVVRLMDELHSRIQIERSPYSTPRADFSAVGADFWKTAGANPYFFADQDLLNAILATVVPPDRIEVLDRRVEAILPFTGLRVVDAEALRCEYEDGEEPHAVHHFLPQKPWLEPTTPGVYTELLVRLLRGRDVAIQVSPNDLPPHLKAAPLGNAGRALARLGGRLRGVPGGSLARIRARLGGGAAR